MRRYTLLRCNGSYVRSFNATESQAIRWAGKLVVRSKTKTVSVHPSKGFFFGPRIAQLSAVSNSI